MEKIFIEWANNNSVITPALRRVIYDERKRIEGRLIISTWLRVIFTQMLIHENRGWRNYDASIERQLVKASLETTDWYEVTDALIDLYERGELIY